MKDTPIIRLVFSSAGGYAHHYLKAFFNLPDGIRAEIRAVYDPVIESLSIYPDLVAKQIPCYNKYSDFVDTLKNIDLVVIASPIHKHASQAIDALTNDCNVLLEKPLSVSLQQSRDIINACNASERWLMTGYQWSFSSAIRGLKMDILNGVLGKVRRAKTLVLWPRDYSYYHRNDWAGKAINNTGEVVNDNPVNNAMAHFLHNLLYLTGSDMEASSHPVSGEAELYRAYDIQSFDTAVLELVTDKGVRLGFYGSHVSRTEKGPLFILECEKAVVYYGELSKDIVAVFNDGKIKNYGNPDDTDQFHKLSIAIDACSDNSLIVCPPEASIEQTRVIDALAKLKVINNFKASSVIDTVKRRYVEGLSYMLYSSYQQGVMPGRTGLPAGVSGQELKFD
ncbi:MAG: Gfo/Idh/MocA family oxidoreductase [Bacteroidales bacterium]|nr:Gfo/Idh/MocA family oxidoreductase [Bacteroidales bacterium]